VIFPKQSEYKKRTKNRPCMVIRGRETLFVPIFIPYMLGDLLKIKWVKNKQQIIRAW